MLLTIAVPKASSKGMQLELKWRHIHVSRLADEVSLALSRDEEVSLTFELRTL